MKACDCLCTLVMPVSALSQLILDIAADRPSDVVCNYMVRKYRGLTCGWTC